MDWAILAVAAFNLIAGLIPTKGRFVADDDEEELTQRPEGGLQDPSNPLRDMRRFFGITRFGFTKQNELFVGRISQLGFASSLIGEGLTGKGILGQFDMETNISLNQTEPLLLAFIVATLFFAINEGTGKFVDED